MINKRDKTIGFFNYTFYFLAVGLLFMLHPMYAEARVINRIIAVVNDEVITQEDVTQLLSVLYAQYVQAYKGEDLLKKMEDVKKNILRQMLEDRLILSRAKELDVRVTGREVDEKLEYVKSGFSSEDEFYDMLDAQGITVADLKDRYSDQIMMKKLVDFEIKSRVTVLPSEISEYYEKHRLELKRDEKYRVRHILIKADNEVDSEMVKLEIQNVHNRLKAGDDFSKLARAYSQGGNSEEGGDMGYIGRGEMRQGLEGAIFVLKPGEFSEPVRSHIGYHIFKVEDVKHSGYLSLEDVQEDIKRMLFQKKFEEKLNKWVADLEENAYISIK